MRKIKLRTQVTENLITSDRVKLYLDEYVYHNKVHVLVSRDLKIQSYSYTKDYIFLLTQISEQDLVRFYDHLRVNLGANYDRFNIYSYPDYISDRYPDVTLDYSTYQVTYNKNLPSSFNVPIKLCMYVSNNPSNTPTLGVKEYLFTSLQNPSVTITDLFPEDQTISFIGDISFYEELEYKGNIYKSLIKTFTSVKYNRLSDKQSIICTSLNNISELVITNYGIILSDTVSNIDNINTENVAKYQTTTLNDDNITLTSYGSTTVDTLDNITNLSTENTFRISSLSMNDDYFTITSYNATYYQ